MANGYLSKLKHPRDMDGHSVEPPLFKLGGLAVGNGFTDAETQLAVQAEVAFNMGLIDLAQRRRVEAMQEETLALVRAKHSAAARTASDAVMAFITNASASASLEDIRR